MAMLEVRDLEVFYGMIQAIKGISFEVNEGEVIALIGANGAGKTTTLHTVSGLLAPKAGTVTFEGKDITKTPAHKIVSCGMAHVPEGRRVFASLSVYQNLKMALIQEATRKRLKSLSGWYIPVSPGWRNGKISRPERFQAVSSRCSPWGGR